MKCSREHTKQYQQIRALAFNPASHFSVRSSTHVYIFKIACAHWFNTKVCEHFVLYKCFLFCLLDALVTLKIWLCLWDFIELAHKRLASNEWLVACIRPKRSTTMNIPSIKWKSINDFKNKPLPFSSCFDTSLTLTQQNSHFSGKNSLSFQAEIRRINALYRRCPVNNSFIPFLRISSTFLCLKIAIGRVIVLSRWPEMTWRMTAHIIIEIGKKRKYLHWKWEQKWVESTVSFPHEAVVACQFTTNKMKEKYLLDLNRNGHLSPSSEVHCTARA